MNKHVAVLVSFALASIGVLAVGVAPAGAAAGNVGPITFESGYSNGSIYGQNGWAGADGCSAKDQGVVNNSSFPSSGLSAGKSFRLSNAVTCGSFQDPTTPSAGNEAGETTALNGGKSGGVRQDYFEAQWTLASSTGAVQPGLSISMSADRGDGARMSYVRAVHDTDLELFFDDVQGVDPPQSTPCFQCANFVETSIGHFNAAVPHTIKLTMQFVDGPSNDVVNVYVDSTLVHTGGSWEDYYTLDTESSPTLADQFSRTVDSVLFRAGGTAVPATSGNGFLFDDISVTTVTPLCTTTCYVSPGGAGTQSGIGAANALPTIQSGIDLVAAGGTVRVLPGNYSETAPNSAPTSIGGTYTFGLFLGSAKDGVTVMGVTNADAPITDPNAVLANITTNSDANFGPDGTFVEADNVTLQGLHFLSNTPDVNKTIEVVGDAFTLKYSSIDDTVGALYISDFRYNDGGTPSDPSDDVSHVQSFTIDGNNFPLTPIIVASGAGKTGPASGRKIINNTFTNDATLDYPSISVRGAGGRPWYQYPVGGIQVSGNDFTNTDADGIFIRTTQGPTYNGDGDGNIGNDADTNPFYPNGYANSQFDWAAIFAGNTFHASAEMVLASPPGNVRSYEDAQYRRVRRIAVNEPAANEAGTIADDGDTVAAWPPAAVPGAPTAVSASPGNQFAVVSFTPPASDGGSAITAYTATCAAAAHTTRSASANVSPITVNNLDNSIQYSCTVHATNSVGNSAESTAALVTPSSASPPAPPTGVAAFADNTKATVTWVAPANDGGATITGYTVTAAPGAGTCSWSSGPLACDVTGLTNGTDYTFTVTATSSPGTSLPSAPSNAVTPLTWAGHFNPLTPARVLDTRFANGHSGAVGAGETVNLQVTGRGGVPASGVTAVVMNVAVTNPTALSFLTIWPQGTAQPNTANLNFVAGQTKPNLVTVKVGATGMVSIFNNAGSTNVVADVFGWYSDATVTGGSRFQALDPARILDTRFANGHSGTVGASETIDLQVTGRGGVPSTGVTAVVMNVAVTGPSAASFLTIWPQGTARPNTANLNFVTGQTVPNLVTVKVPANGQVSIFNGAGNTHVVADVFGWYSDTSVAGGSRFQALDPARILDTRFANGHSGTVGAGETISLQVTGRGGVPASGVTAVVMNVAVTNPSAASFLTIWPQGTACPTTANLNFLAGQTVPNLVVVKVGPTGMVNIFNGAGSTHVIADVFGWFSTPGP